MSFLKLNVPKKQKPTKKKRPAGQEGGDIHPATFIAPANYSPKRKEAHDFVNAMFQGISASVFTQPARDSFRVSSFPYCPLLDLEGKLFPEQEETDYGFEFYTSIGTSVHETLQKHLMHSLNPNGFEYSVGFWKCLSCEHVHKDKIDTCPKKCKECGTKRSEKKFEYVEVEFDYKGLSGHLDYLTFHPRIGYMSWEFKTKGLKYIENPSYQKYLPDAKHPHQIETYNALLKLQYGIDVAFYNIIYVSREKPHVISKTIQEFYAESSASHSPAYYPIVREFTPKLLRKRVDLIENACKGRERVEALNTLIKKKGSISDKRLRRIWEGRPCKSQLSYNNYMKDKFYKGQCPNYKACIKDSYAGLALHKYDPNQK